MSAVEDFPAPLYALKANLYKGLAHPVRVRVLELLTQNGEVSVADLLTSTGVEASNLSQHLSVLRRYQLVHAQRRGLQVYYSVASSHVVELLSVSRALLHDVLEATHQHLLTDPFRADSAAL